MPEYVELLCRSAFSFLRGASAPERLAVEAARMGLGALALSDDDGVYGLARFYFAAKEAGIRPLLGARVGLREGGRVALLVQDRRGWRNLCRLLSELHCGDDPARFEKALPAGSAAWQRMHRREKNIALERLEACSEGLLCVADGLCARNGEQVRARELVERLCRTFGRERVGLPVVRPATPAGSRRNRFHLELAEATGAIPFASAGVQYASPAEKPVHDIFTCLRHHVRLDDAGALLSRSASRHLHSPRRMAQLFRDRPELLSNTLRLAERCAFELEDLGYRFPDFPVPPGQTQEGLLRRLVWQGARRRYGRLTERHRRQLEHELRVIEELGFCGYFLLVWDICRFCREHDIMVQGRGSAANSAVCYVLGITAVDPIGMGLLFERFLSAERGQWPDIDLDLPSGDRREAVLRYLWGRYGRHRAAMTANVITYRLRSAVREVGKVLGFDQPRLERLLVECRGRGENLNLLEAAAAAGLDPSLPRVARLVEIAGAIQGLPRHLGQHSGGMVLCAGRLDEVIPVQPASMPGRTVIQWDKDDCGDLGILKVDLLGLGMLRALERAREILRDRGVRFELHGVPPGDPATYALLRRADTVGVFQVESRAQMNTLPRLKPRCFYDLVVEVAIIRPGPIVGRKVHPYLERRAGRQPVTYPHPRLRPILERTLGIPLFQEQAMRIAMEAAGYSLRQAEHLRRAMSHRRSPEYRLLHQRLLREGLERHGIRGRAADEIIESFGSFFGLYGFPESHAASFALIVYASAYLKAHHPEVFTCALLDAWPMGFYHPSTIVADARRHGVEVLPADVNHSAWYCRIEHAGRKDAVRLGLRFLRGLRREAGERIARQRRVRPFRTVADLKRRAGLERNEIHTLARAGALASLGLGRREALWQASALSGAGPLFERLDSPGEDCPLPEPHPFEVTAADYELVGMSCGPHPMSYLRGWLDRRSVVTSSGLWRLPGGRWVRIAGMVIVRQRPSTAKGMTFLTLEDETGLSNVVVSPPVWERNRSLLVSCRALLVAGRLERRDGVAGVRGEVFEALDHRLPGTTASRDFH